MLGGDKDVVPKAGLQVSLQLGDVEVRAGPLADEVVDVVVEVQAEVEEGAGRHLAVDGDVRLVQMPAAGPDEEDGRVAVLLGGVDLAVLGVGVGDGAPDGVAEVALPLGQVAPRRRGRVLEIGHVHVGSGVEAVNDHLPIDGSRNLDAAVLQVGGDRRALPRRRVVVRLRLPAAIGEATVMRDEMRLTAGIELHGPRRAGRQQGPAAVLELVAQKSDEAEGVRREHLGGGGADGGVDLHLNGGWSDFHFSAGL